jgi:geranylgeranyl pyrophosphate synthase
MGKPVASDLRLGLVTSPALYYLEANPGDQRLQKLQNGDKLPDAEMDALIADIRASGSLSASNEEAYKLIREANASLDELPNVPEKLALIELAEYVVGRLH